MNKSMFWTKAARVVAVIAFVLGVISVLYGVAVATELAVELETGRYLGGKSSGRAIDQGILQIAFSVIVGVLSEISRSLSGNEKKNG